MYYCKDCGRFFEKPARKMVWGYKEAVCPKCESDFVTETAECKLCGCNIDPDNEYCPDCQGAIEKAVDIAIASLSAGRGTSYLPAKRAIADMLGE